MPKFWYGLVDERANLSVKLAEKNTVVFSKRLGEVEQLMEENAMLDAMVKKGVLTKKTDAERKISAKKAVAAEAKAAEVKAPAAKVEPQKPEVIAEAPKAEAPKAKQAAAKAEAPKAEPVKEDSKAETK